MKGIVKMLRKRAQDFLTDAYIDLNEGRYEIAAFHVEQFLRLFLKSAILEFGVQFPKTHSIRKLLKILSKLKKDSKLLALSRKREAKELEEIYLSSRYLPFQISKSDVKRYLNFANEVKKLLVKE